MNITLDIKNADIALIKALKSVIQLHPNVKFKIKEKNLLV